ncbi:unnamed protein product [Symbiodinium sp. CCMP2592]|nr:unnamed protein product [Symbiodinium sp. CCMP2592]
MSIELRMLRSWAAEVCADSIDLLLRLKMIGDHAGGWAQVLEPIEASEFARRLEVLGFPGEPAEIAAEVARCRGNGAASQISVEHVCCALFGLKQFRRAPGTAKDAVKTKPTPTTPVRKKNPIRKAEWDSSIFSGFCANASRPASLRVYFSSPPKDPVMHRAASNPALSRPATVATGPMGPSANKGGSAQEATAAVAVRRRTDSAFHAEPAGGLWMLFDASLTLRACAAVQTQTSLQQDALCSEAWANRGPCVRKLSAATLQALGLRQSPSVASALPAAPITIQRATFSEVYRIGVLGGSLVSLLGHVFRFNASCPLVIGFGAAMECPFECFSGLRRLGECLNGPLSELARGYRDGKAKVSAALLELSVPQAAIINEAAPSGELVADAPGESEEGSVQAGVHIGREAVAVAMHRMRIKQDDSWRQDRELDKEEFYDCLESYSISDGDDPATAHMDVADLFWW